jgi:hypothetical protein
VRLPAPQGPSRAKLRLIALAARHDGLAGVCSRMNEDRNRWRPHCGIAGPRRSALVPASTKPVVFPAVRSVYKRCSIDCGVPQRRCKNCASLRDFFRSTGALWVAGFLLNRGFSQE